MKTGDEAQGIVSLIGFLFLVALVFVNGWNQTHDPHNVCHPYLFLNICERAASVPAANATKTSVGLTAIPYWTQAANETATARPVVIQGDLYGGLKVTRFYDAQTRTFIFVCEKDYKTIPCLVIPQTPLPAATP